jgi:hypothetical protein
MCFSIFLQVKYVVLLRKLFSIDNYYLDVVFGL